MKKLTLLLICGLAILATPLSTTAQEQPIPTMRKLPVIIDCGTAEEVDKVIKDYPLELPFAEAESILQLPNGGMIMGDSVIYIDPKSGSYTIVTTIRLPEGTENNTGIKKCIIGFGTKFRPSNYRIEHKT